MYVDQDLLLFSGRFIKILAHIDRIHKDPIRLSNARIKSFEQYGQQESSHLSVAEEQHAEYVICPSWKKRDTS
jgi:hypothetical protein